MIKYALAAWEKMLEQDKRGERPLYRERGWMKEKRSKEKERKRRGWYKKLGGQTNDFTVFCPMSPGGRLAAMWRGVMEEVRRSSGGRVKGYVAEQLGIPLSALLYTSQPGETDDCGKVDCNPCRRGTTCRLSCRRVARGGLVYSCTCLTCKEAGEESWYHGQTAKSLYTRQGQHVAGLELEKLDNAMFKHQENQHPDMEPKFQFQTEKFCGDPLTKQILEGVSINNSPSAPGLLMNSRAEFQQGQVARVEVVRGLGD